MFIRNPDDFKSILQGVEDNLPSSEFIVLNIKKDSWDKNLISKEIEKQPKIPNFHIAIQVEHDNFRIDTIIFSSGNKIDADVLKKIDDYIRDVPTDVSILKVLEQHWKNDNKKYPFLMMFTTHPNSNSTIICYRAVAPFFREKGMMKKASLNFIGTLQKHFGTDHQIRSFAIHAATYLFFNPRDKELQHFYPEELQEITCEFLLKSHGIIRDISDEFALPKISSSMFALIMGMNQNKITNTHIPDQDKEPSDQDLKPK